MMFVQAEYMKWAKTNNFISMLPKDRKSQKDKSERSHQTQLHAHLQPVTPKERVIPYTDDWFRKAAIQWLVTTDQVTIIEIARTSIAQGQEGSAILVETYYDSGRFLVTTKE